MPFNSRRVVKWTSSRFNVSLKRKGSTQSFCFYCCIWARRHMILRIDPTKGVRGWNSFGAGKSSPSLELCTSKASNIITTLCFRLKNYGNIKEIEANVGQKNCKSQYVLPVGRIRDEDVYSLSKTWREISKQYENKLF